MIIMFKYKWTHKTIYTNQDAEEMRSLFKRTTHFAAAFDTETTGLHHIFDKPFLFQFGWCTEEDKGYTFAVDIERQPILAKQVITIWHALVKTVPKYLAHNVKFDLNMLQNIGCPYIGDNISDLTIFIRLGTDAVATKHGGAPMKLKDFAKSYIDVSAKDFEQKLKQERKDMATEYNVKLRKRLGMSQKAIDTFFKDKLNTPKDLPEDKYTAYMDWITLDLPLVLQRKVMGKVSSDDIQYNMLNRDMVLHYAHLDIVWVLEGYVRLAEAVRLRGNMEAIRLEEANIYPVLAMERQGFCVDVDYLHKAQQDVKQYILERRSDLFAITNCKVSVGQHELLKQLILQLFNCTVTATGNDELSLLRSQLIHKGNNEALVEFIELIQELRTLEKWYSTYIVRFVKAIDLYNTNRIYTTINLNGTVSGRVTSDFQQFPKDAIITITGEELFHPRKMVLVDKENDFQGIVYLDYSQIELRLQAMYTILVGHPDTNLCRAYSPYDCHTFVEGKQKLYDCTDKWCIQHAYDCTWYYNEEPDKVWSALDVHGATTKCAFDIDESHPDFHRLRYIGKRVNFAKNYGAQRGKIAEMFPEYDDAQIDKIDQAYYAAFPGVKQYHDYCYKLANLQPYAQNLFGVRYYNVSGHNLINMLIQGTGAYFLKWKIAQVSAYMKEHQCKSKLQMQIHDELSFEWHKDDDVKMYYDIKHILETWDDTLIPIVADMEITRTNWAEKEEVDA